MLYKEQRQALVQLFYNDETLRITLREKSLKRMCDMERIAKKFLSGKGKLQVFSLNLFLLVFFFCESDLDEFIRIFFIIFFAYFHLYN